MVLSREYELFYEAPDFGRGQATWKCRDHAAWWFVFLLTHLRGAPRSGSLRLQVARRWSAASLARNAAAAMTRVRCRFQPCQERDQQRTSPRSSSIGRASYRDRVSRYD